MLNLLQAAGYKLPNQAIDTGTVNKSLMGTSLGVVSIIHLDAEGSALETWTLKNAFIKSVKFSDLDYDSEDLSTCDLELRYDWAELVSTAGDRNADSNDPEGVTGNWKWTSDSTAAPE